MNDDLDIDRLRADTPGCAVGGFFNHSGASLSSARTLSAITNHLQQEALYGGMEAAAAAARQLAKVRADAEALLGASANEVAFTSSASAAIGLAFAALPALKPGERILVGRHEWGGNVSTYQAAAARAGAQVEVIPCREDDGSVDAEALERMVDDRVRLVSLTWLPANGGLVNDAAAIGRVTRAAGIPYFVDAGQALGQMPVNVEEIGCDVLKGTARKFLRGPRGTALLYVRTSFMPRLRPAFIDVQSGPWTEGAVKQRADARVFETIEGSVALLLGLGAALEQAHAIGMQRIQRRIAMLAQRLRDALSAVDGVVVQDLGSTRSGIVSFTVRGLGAQMVRERLAEQGITVGANGVTCTPFDMTERGLHEIGRASVSYLNTEGEVDQLAAALRSIVARA
jgi:selenocysteine lyase/cysteine desulfurase